MSTRITRLLRRNKPVAPPQDEDPWRSGRSRWGLQSFRRGQDRKWHFSGQGKDETVKMVVRKHWITLLKPALAPIGLVIFLFVVLALHMRFPLLHPLWVGMEFVIVVLTVATVIWFLYKD